MTFKENFKSPVDKLLLAVAVAGAITGITGVILDHIIIVGIGAPIGVTGGVGLMIRGFIAPIPERKEKDEDN